MPESSPTAGDQSFLRRLNASAILGELRRHGPQTLSEIVQRTKLSRPTVEGAADDLVEQGWAEQLAPEGGGVGRPARRYRFRSEAGFVLGLDVGAHKALALVADLDGNVLATRRARVRIGMAASDRIAAAESVARGTMSDARIGDNALVGVGVGTPGVVDDSGTVVFTDVLPYWAGRSLSAEIGRGFPCPVVVENDANLAALAERWQGVATAADDVVYVLVGQRMGTGVVLGGRLHRGHGGAAGEVAYMDLLGLRSAMEGFRRLSPSRPEEGGDGSGELLGDPAHGAHERESATSPGLRRHADDVDAASVFAAMRAGDPGAAAIVDTFTHDLSRGIAAMALTVDPELVVIGGGVSQAGELFLPNLRRYLDRLCIRSPRVEISALSDESVALGAVRRALDDAELRLFTPVP